MKTSVKFGKEDYAEERKTKEGRMLPMRFHVKGWMQMMRRTLRSPSAKMTEADFDEMLGEYAKFWLLDQHGVETYPLSKKDNRAEGAIL